MKNMLKPEFVNKWIVRLASIAAAYEEKLLSELIETLRSQPNASDVAYIAYRLLKNVEKEITKEALRELLKELPGAVV